MSVMEMLIAADLLEESGFEASRLLREMAGACEPRQLEPWEVLDNTIKSPVENRIEYWCRLFRSCLEKQVDRQRSLPPFHPDSVDQAVYEITVDGMGSFLSELV